MTSEPAKTPGRRAAKPRAAGPSEPVAELGAPASGKTPRAPRRTAGTGAPPAAPKEDGPGSIRDLLSYKLSATANMISRSAALRFRQEFDVSLGEWRTLALVGDERAMSLNNLARAANLDKGQMSRVVSSLVERGLIARETAGGGRTIRLSLTRQGEHLHRRLMQVAGERNLAFLACVTPAERDALESALPKLHALARALSHSPVARPRTKPPVSS